MKNYIDDLESCLREDLNCYAPNENEMSLVKQRNDILYEMRWINICMEWMLELMNYSAYEQLNVYLFL